MDHIEMAKNTAAVAEGLPPDIQRLFDDFSGAKHNNLMSKLDAHLISIIAPLYLLAYIDRGNIGNARLAGLERDLDLNDKQYNAALTIFFVSYCVFEVPASMALKYFKPRTWISVITISWGIAMSLMGIVQNYPGLLTARFFLGVPEAGIFPACAYYITCWYTRHESMYRTALFYGLLAYAITLMDGIGGLAGWQWIFVLEGILTVFSGGAAFFFIYDSPDAVSWLTKEEKKYVKLKLAYDGSVGGNATEEEGSKKKYAKDAFSDRLIYLSVIMSLGISVSTYGIIFGLPTIVANLTSTRKEASPSPALSALLAIIGFVLAIASSGNKDLAGLTYAGCFLACCGFFPAFPGVISWLANNLAGPYKRAVGMGLQISLGNTSGFMGSNTYRAQDKPAYRLGYGLSLGFMGAALLVALTMILALSDIIRRRQKYIVKNSGAQAVLNEVGEHNLTEMGDKSPLFRYTL
ncbi:major facilitator superfamily domain-containing protein [Dactylonectria estremocensis]|uniref:Major facilitator superfamily domain-containing protein n=1 Tax=Dactylonectria estremocensis TaxID=1079267 RepID=A0A9P9E3M3_9HYPO|nr:major facilitator superfamily domain-containing protein [Dactylonectria estremocensis]